MVRRHVLVQLRQPMGTSYRVDPGDIINAKTALSQLGYYSSPTSSGIQPWTDDAMFSGIRSFQRDNGLQADGFMRPGGPTEGAINRSLTRASFSGASHYDATPRLAWPMGVCRGR